MQACFLQTEKDRIGAVEVCRVRARTNGVRGLPGGSSLVGSPSCKLLFAAFFENAQNVSRIAQVETRQRLDEGQDAVDARVFRRDRRVVDQVERRAIGAVGLAEAIIFQIEPPLL